MTYPCPRCGLLQEEPGRCRYCRQFHEACEAIDALKLDLAASQGDVVELQGEVKRLEEREAELAADRFYYQKKLEKAQEAAIYYFGRACAYMSDLGKKQARTRAEKRFPWLVVLLDATEKPDEDPDP